MMQATTNSHRLSRLIGHRFFLLFFFLLATLIVYPYAETTRFGYYAFRILGSGAILASVYAANVRRTLLILAIALAVPSILQHIILPRIHFGSFAILNIVLSFTFDVIIIVVIFQHVFSAVETNSETIFGALCVYLLVGFSFASIYGLLFTFEPNAFYLDPHFNLRPVPDRFDFVYYSFGSMTSLGAAGITPVTGEARSVTILEAILGVLYLAVLIARLMGAYRSGPKR